jgi:hypothetical protein
MDMKILIMALSGAAALLTACLDINNKQEFIPGTYVSSTHSKKGNVMDTIMIWHQAGQLYQIMRKQAERRQNGKQRIDWLPRCETGVAVFLPQDQILVEREHGLVLTFNEQRNVVLVNGRPFQRSVR